ncbi:disease resistance protein SUMM2-like [Papaver somniferum]|uniref:disease resistance protein SUMM2-like n=1 Tax=Papaver somniferum TaxID=3469 RepID=UPI000E701BDF|nr:disease resistance protein SUMM2-like [Papaver somniferum]
MEIVGPVVDIISCLWNCSAVHGKYYPCEIKQNVKSLKNLIIKLRERRDDVKERVDIAESNPTKPVKRTHEVGGWLPRVEALEQQVENILREVESAYNGGGSYFCCWGRKNCCSGYRLGKLVVEKINAVEKLLEEGNFNAVVEESQPDPIREICTNKTLGMDQKLEHVWSLLVDETSPVRVIGLHGMGGVGKTTLIMNLNNEFLKRNHPFDSVIWAVVSKDFDVKNIQNQIGKSLGLSWSEETIDDRAKDLTQVLKNKKFVLFLDDIWKRVDLQIIGIQSQELTKSRVVFSTRCESVCGCMKADEIIKVNCLDWNDSWRLFQQNVGQRALSFHTDVSNLSKKVAKECLGLPLALIAIGRTMATKLTLQEWKHAHNVLKKSASEFSGMVDEVLVILKFSYDNLQNEKLKSCFLCCSLYPEDYLIGKDKLIRLWLGEGFLDEVDDMDEAYTEGHDVIDSLKSARLLENGPCNCCMEDSVKMHDVVHDLAIWIASDIWERKGKHLAVQAGSKLKLREWKKAEKISLIGNISIKQLSGAPNCLYLSTLLLQSSNVRTISDDFFQCMPMLKVLDMSGGKIREKLPPSIFSLTELEYLDLSCVDRRNISRIELSPQTLGCLTKLKMLDLFNSQIYNWEELGGPSLSDLECLKALDYLGINLETVVALQKLVSIHKLQLSTKLLLVNRCEGITTLVLSPMSLPSSPISSIVSLASMVSLKSLHLKMCDELEELRIMSCVGMEDNVTLLMTLEKLYIDSIWNCQRLCGMCLEGQGFCFLILKDVSIMYYPKVKDVSWLIYAQNLEKLELFCLQELEEVISDRFAGEDMLSNVFSRLKHLKLHGLRNLKKISFGSYAESKRIIYAPYAAAEHDEVKGD